jgi:hypothetical protein
MTDKAKDVSIVKNLVISLVNAQKKETKEIDMIGGEITVETVEIDMKEEIVKAVDMNDKEMIAEIEENTRMKIQEADQTNATSIQREETLVLVLNKVVITKDITIEVRILIIYLDHKSKGYGRKDDY